MNEKISIEAMMKKMESIAKEFEKDNLPIEDMINLFEDGMKLRDKCTKELDSIKMRFVAINQNTVSRVESETKKSNDPDEKFFIDINE